MREKEWQFGDIGEGRIKDIGFQLPAGFMNNGMAPDSILFQAETSGAYVLSYMQSDISGWT